MEDYCVFIGDVALDEYYQAPYWPSLKEKVLVESLKPHYGGMIANSACVYAAFGEHVKFSTVLNHGTVTQLLLANLRDQNIDTDLMVFNDELPDSKCIIFLAEGEHTVFIPSLHLERQELSPEMLDVLVHAKLVYSTPSEMRHLHCGDLTDIDIIARIRENGATIAYDMDVGYYAGDISKYYKAMDIAFFNEVGFANYKKDRPDDEAVQQLLDWGTKVVVVTLAANGCRVYTQTECFTSPAARVEDVDVTGAGDTFCASFVYAYTKTGNVHYATRFANAAAGICVSHVGARSGAVGESAVVAAMQLLPEA